MGMHVLAISLLVSILISLVSFILHYLYLLGILLVLTCFRYGH